MEKELSDLKLTRVECPKCKATWVNGNHVWATGNPGSEEDLAGLVCNKLGDDTCINPKRGSETGDTWEKRSSDLNFMYKTKKSRLEAQRQDFKDKYGEDPHFDD